MTCHFLKLLDTCAVLNYTLALVPFVIFKRFDSSSYALRYCTKFLGFKDFNGCLFTTNNCASYVYSGNLNTKGSNHGLQTTKQPMPGEILGFCLNWY